MLSSVASLVLLGACSAKSNHPASTETSAGGVVGGGRGSSGGGTTDGGATDGGGSDGGACNTLALTNASIIGQQQVAEAVPVPAGGAIADGTYVLSKDTIFTGPGGTTGATGVTTQEVQSFGGTRFELLSQSAAPAPAVDVGGTFTISSVTSDAGTSTGFTLTFTLTCPTARTTQRSYSVVNGTTLLEFVGANEVLTYTLL